MSVIRAAHAFSASVMAADDRRLHDRVSGPFDGRRDDLLSTPLRIYDLSEGGCFVNSMHEQQPGVAFTLEIDVPGAGWLTLKAETLYGKPEFGFAVRFIDMPDDTASQLREALQRLRRGRSTES